MPPILIPADCAYRDRISLRVDFLSWTLVQPRAAQSFFHVALPKADIRQCKNECSLWVKSRHVAVQSVCPLCPRKRHQMRHMGMSALGQKRTHAVQQKDRYSITSSARESKLGDTSRPSARAVGRLMTRSNLVGC